MAPKIKVNSSIGVLVKRADELIRKSRFDVVSIKSILTMLERENGLSS
jgi:hypothetical protein